MNDALKNDLLLEVKHMVNFPYPQICRHSVALNILNLMEKHGYVIPDGLAKAICNGCNGDDEAMEILAKELQCKKSSNQPEIHEHQFDYDGGTCRKCGKTASEMFNK